MATQKSSAPAHPSEDHDDTVEAHYASLERPHACTDSVVYIGHLVEDPGTGAEAEVIEAVPCRRCAEEEKYGIHRGWLSRFRSRSTVLALPLCRYAKVFR